MSSERFSNHRVLLVLVQPLHLALGLQARCLELLLKQARQDLGMAAPAIHRALRLLPNLEPVPRGPIPVQVFYPHHLQDRQRLVAFVQLPVPPSILGQKHL